MKFSTRMAIRCIPSNIHLKSEFLMNLPEVVEPGTFPISKLLEINPRLGQLKWDVDIPALEEMGFIVCEFSGKNSIDDIQKDPEDVLYNVLWFISEVESGKTPKEVLRVTPTVFTYQHLELVLHTCRYLLLSDYVPFGVRTLVYKCLKCEYKIYDILTSIIHFINIEKHEGRYSESIFKYYNKDNNLYVKFGILIIDESQKFLYYTDVPCVDTYNRLKKSGFIWW